MKRELLAKSWKDDREPWNESMWLPVHLQDVHAAACKILLATGDDQFLSVGVAEWRTVSRTLWIGSSSLRHCFVHDTRQSKRPFSRV